MSRSFPATQAGIAAASAFLDEVAEAAYGKAADGFPVSALPTLHVVLDEVAANVVMYSGAKDFEVRVRAIIGEDGTREAEIAVSDNGVPFDPLAHSDPDTTLPAADRPIGGLGIMMVRKMSDSISYKRDGDRNVLVVRCREKKSRPRAT